MYSRDVSAGDWRLEAGASELHSSSLQFLEMQRSQDPGKNSHLICVEIEMQSHAPPQNRDCQAIFWTSSLQPPASRPQPSA